MTRATDTSMIEAEIALGKALYMEDPRVVFGFTAEDEFVTATDTTSFEDDLHNAPSLAVECRNKASRLLAWLRAEGYHIVKGEA